MSKSGKAFPNIYRERAALMQDKESRGGFFFLSLRSVCVGVGGVWRARMLRGKGFNY